MFNPTGCIVGEGGCEGCVAKDADVFCIPELQTLYIQIYENMQHIYVYMYICIRIFGRLFICICISASSQACEHSNKQFDQLVGNNNSSMRECIDRNSYTSTYTYI